MDNRSSNLERGFDEGRKRMNTGRLMSTESEGRGKTRTREHGRPKKKTKRRLEGKALKWTGLEQQILRQVGLIINSYEHAEANSRKLQRHESRAMGINKLLEIPGE